MSSAAHLFVAEWRCACGLYSPRFLRCQCARWETSHDLLPHAMFFNFPRQPPLTTTVEPRPGIMRGGEITDLRGTILQVLQNNKERSAAFEKLTRS